MARLSLNLLGPLRVTCDGSPVAFSYDKVPALLAYIAVESHHPHSREALAELLWPDRPSATSRHSLSQALTALRQAIDVPACFSLTRETVQFIAGADCSLDVAEFGQLLDDCERHAHPRREACAECAARLEQAAALYRGDFLAKFSVGDSAAYEDWAVLQRETLHRRVMQAFTQSADYAEAQNDPERAIAAARRQLELEPWGEPAHRRLMRLLASNGDRAAALTQYERCRESLAAELGVEPEAETEALYEQIKAGELSGRRPGESRVPPPLTPAQRHNLPAQPTPLIGRETELAKTAALLADPSCRLITLVGPGGIGKTRLAMHTAAEQIGKFTQGVWFVALAPLSSPDLIASAIAEALAFTPYGAESLQIQLLNFLHDQELLLVLDNFEHLLTGAALLTGILAQAPQVKLLVTSRARLALRGEWAFEVGGLSIPDSPEAADLERYGAVQLFAHSARRARSSFEFQPDNRSHVVRICQLVRGMPLGIELAAAWLPVLSAEEVASEIARSLDFLATELSDVPERHRSMRAVFDQSWRLLTEPERGIFRRLSVFRGGFTREAAEVVAGAALVDLSRLAAKSLIQRPASGRYEVHELLRQYGESKLGERTDEARQTRERHGRYYLTFLAAREAALKGHGHQAALTEVESEMENIRTAWVWAAQPPIPNLIAQSVEAFWLFAEVQGRYSEAEIHFRLAAEGLEQAAEDLTDRALALGKIMARQASWFIRLGEPERTREMIGHGLALLRPLNAQLEIAFALNILAAAAHVQGAYAEEQGYLHESIALGQASGDRWITGYSLNDLGMATFLLGDAVEARRQCEASLAIFREIGDGRGMAFALKNLGAIAGHVGDYAGADQLLRDGLELWRASGHRWGVATTLIHLGVIARARRDFPTARACFLEAIQVAMDVQTLPAALDALVELAALAIEGGDRTQAGSIVLAVLRHPARTAAAQARAEHLRSDLDLPPNAPAPDVNTLVAALLDPKVPAAI